MADDDAKPPVKVRQVVIDEAFWRRALEIGRGNASRGIRIALRNYQPATRVVSISDPIDALQPPAPSSPARPVKRGGTRPNPGGTGWE